MLTKYVTDSPDVDGVFKTSNCFKGNANLKNANVKLNITRQQMAEYIKCQNDAVYFIKRYVKIVNLDVGLTDFILRDYQEEIINVVNTSRFTICKMARQSGKTSTIVGYFLWFVLFHPDKVAGILANAQNLAIEILSRLKDAYEYLPWWLQQGVLTWNKKKIELENGSKVMAGSTSANSVRGQTFNIILLDEFAHVPHYIAEAFFESVYPTISSGQDSKIIIVSTPKGLNLFYKMWTDSEEGRNDYKRVEVDWTQIPGRDEEWKRKTIANTSERQFDQEFACRFHGSSNTLISGEKLRSLAYRKPIRELATQHTDDKMRVYYEPEKGRAYAMTVDVSEGVGMDASAFSIFDVTEFPYRQVAVYASKHISELLFPDVIRAAAMFYNEATVLIENNTGREVANTLEMDLEYGNIVSVGQDKRLGQIAGGGAGKKIGNGVKMTKSVKRIGCTTLKTAIENDKLIVNDFDTIWELQNFVATGTSYAADGDGHDDLAMTLVLFSWLTTQEYFKNISDLDLRRKLMEQKAKEVEEDVLPMFSSRHDPENPAVFVAKKDKKKDIWHTVEDRATVRQGIDPAVLEVGFTIFR